MPAPTRSTTVHSHDVTARTFAMLIHIWARRIVTEVGSQLLDRAQLITADWAAR